jgi:hypothetical protein
MSFTATEPVLTEFSGVYVIPEPSASRRVDTSHLPTIDLSASYALSLQQWITANTVVAHKDKGQFKQTAPRVTKFLRFAAGENVSAEQAVEQRFKSLSSRAILSRWVEFLVKLGLAHVKNYVLSLISYMEHVLNFECDRRSLEERQPLINNINHLKMVG